MRLVAEGYGGHTQMLALFDRSEEPGYAGRRRKTTTVDHLALEAKESRLGQRGLAVGTAEHAWVGWRSLYFEDPQGHTVELVCYDPAVRYGPEDIAEAFSMFLDYFMPHKVLRVSETEKAAGMATAPL